MSRNGSGNYTAPASSFPVVGGTVIEATKFNTTVNDIAAALTGSIAADGQTPITANLPMGNHKLTGLLAGTVSGDSVRYEELVALIAATGRNDIINGLFRVAQRGTSFPAIVAGAWDLDGWVHNKVSAAVLTIAQTAGSATTKFGRSVTFTTADAAVAATDFIVQQTYIRGYEAAKYLNATFTLSFDVTSAVTGIHCVSIYNGTSVYVAEYTINVANTEESKTITIAGGSPLIANYNNLAGLIVSFVNAGGANFQQAAGSWINSANSFACTAAQVNDAGTINNVFKTENVVMNLGTVPVIDYKDYAEDLAFCQQFYFSDTFSLHGYGAAGAAFGVRAPTKVTMNTVPTVTLSGFTYTNATGAVAAVVTTNGARIVATVTALGAAIVAGTVTFEAPL
jgi:hypothetical protein